MRRLKTIIVVLAMLLLITVFLYFYRQPEIPQTPQEITFERIRKISRLCKQFRAQNGIWPTNTLTLYYAFGLTNTNMLMDGWGHSLNLYVSPGMTNLYITSYGADGQPGGTGDNADGTMKLEF